MTIQFGDPRLPDRFWDRVIPEPMSGCWLWTGRVDRLGYGAFLRRGSGGLSALPHRESYAALVGPIGDGLDIDHLCRVRSCCNPLHLEPVSHHENCLRGNGDWRSGMTHCSSGHPFDETNTYWPTPNKRSCRECHRRWTREWRLRNEGKKC